MTKNVEEYRLVGGPLDGEWVLTTKPMPETVELSVADGTAIYERRMEMGWNTECFTGEVDVYYKYEEHS